MCSFFEENKKNKRIRAEVFAFSELRGLAKSAKVPPFFLSLSHIKALFLRWLDKEAKLRFYILFAPSHLLRAKSFTFSLAPSLSRRAQKKFFSAMHTCQNAAGLCVGFCV